MTASLNNSPATPCAWSSVSGAGRSQIFCIFNLIYHTDPYTHFALPWLFVDFWPRAKLPSYHATFEVMGILNHAVLPLLALVKAPIVLMYASGNSKHARSWGRTHRARTTPHGHCLRLSANGPTAILSGGDLLRFSLPRRRRRDTYRRLRNRHSWLFPPPPCRLWFSRARRNAPPMCNCSDNALPGTRIVDKWQGKTTREWSSHERERKQWQTPRCLLWVRHAHKKTDVLLCTRLGITLDQWIIVWRTLIIHSVLATVNAFLCICFQCTHVDDTIVLLYSLQKWNRIMFAIPTGNVSLENTGKQYLHPSPSLFTGSD